LLGLEELWLLFGTGKHRRYIAAQEIAKVLGSTWASAVRGFHAFTGCDTVSYLGSIGKKTAWSVWNKIANDDVTQAFVFIGKPAPEIPHKLFTALEKIHCGPLRRTR